MLTAAIATVSEQDRPAVTINNSTVILLDQTENIAIKRAVADLQRDMKKVLGTAPKIISSLAAAAKNENLIVVSCKGTTTKAFREQGITDFEAHLLTTAQYAGHKAVLLQGADTRGTIYAVYTFSEKFLEIPPLWIWTSFEPVKKQLVQLPANTRLYFPPAMVKYRAWFPNDKDLLTPWQAKNAENYDAVFETMLRLKLNTREGYLIDSAGWTNPYQASKEARYARDRGLKLSFTHTAPFGATFTNWERYWKNIRHQKMPLLLKNVNGLKEFWTYHIETIKRERLDVIWQIGFRGLGDKPFWRRTFADAKDEPKEDKDRAAIINSMLALQVALLKEETGESQPLMKITIYNEASDFLAKGLLVLPDEPNLILNYSNVRGDHYPPRELQQFKPELAARPIGYYLNFQFTGTGSHLVAGEGPWKMEQNFRYLAKKIGKVPTFSVVNTGNVREHILELSANAAMMQDFKTYQTDEYLKNYCNTYYGKGQDLQLVNLYRNYYNAYWQPRKSDIPGFDRQYVFQDLRYARGLTQIYTLWNRPYLENPFNDKNKGIGGAMATEGRQFSIVPADNSSNNQVDAAISGLQNSERNFKALALNADSLYHLLPAAKKAFFNDDLYVPIRFMAAANQALAHLVTGYKAKHLGKTDKAKLNVQNTLKALVTLKATKAEVNHGRFSSWSLPEKNFGIDSIQNDIQDLLNSIN
ncbi:glycosyl hydrolase 115 family protein [Pedobacter heparinus]|uniref:glycosyl hydrolase 115 family protein n=1 Tax=Pedobacter heparinus TaxID=984 RepID=UPI00293132D7|nr:glycosyl hydrolase 115 family protein [Pedobacter heparinus]